MKKLVLSALAVGALFAQSNNANLEAKIKKLQNEINQLQQMVISNTKKVNPLFANSHLFFSYDLRTTFDYLHETTTSGYGYTTVTPNSDGTVTFSNMKYVPRQTYVNNIFTNRVILTGVAKPSDNLKATVQIEANNIFGMNSEEQYSPYQNISWVTNETPDDTNLRLKEAFFNYFFGPDQGLMFSAGRRPSTEGFPMNLVYNDPANSPLAHLVNIEFDGFSFEISNDIFSRLSDKFSDWGTWMKFCAGRGYSSSKGIWPYDGTPAYSKDRLGITDFAGFLLIPYDDGQYALWTETIWAWDLKGYNFVSKTDAKNAAQGKAFSAQMDNLGDFFGENIDFKAVGIGNTNSDFLNNTTAFIDFAFTKTMPYSGKQMQGSTKSKTGASIWIGAQMPGIGDNDTWGINYVHGTKYFRPLTYAEDTLAGSIAAVRGNAYDIYYNRQIIPHLTAGLRATYLNYNAAGSNGFFGLSSNPKNPFYVNRAYDIRAYIRYQF